MGEGGHGGDDGGDGANGGCGGGGGELMAAPDGRGGGDTFVSDGSVPTGCSTGFVSMLCTLIGSSGVERKALAASGDANSLPSER